MFEVIKFIIGVIALGVFALSLPAFSISLLCWFLGAIGISLFSGVSIGVPLTALSIAAISGLTMWWLSE